MTDTFSMFKTAVRKFTDLQTIMLVLFVFMDGGCGTWLGNPTNPDENKTPKTEASTPQNPDPAIPPTESAVSLAFYGVKPLSLLSSLQVKGKSGTVIGSLILDKAIIVLGGIEFEKSNTSSASGQIDFEGPYLVDVLNDTVSPEPKTTNLPAGLYKEIKLKMEKLEADKATTISSSQVSQLTDKSVLIKGRFVATSGAVKTFNMTFSLDEEFKLVDSKVGIELKGGVAQNIVIAFNLPLWFDFSDSETNSDSVDFSDLSASTIVLSEDSDGVEKSLHQVIKENIKASSEFGKDDNEDGKID